MTTRLLSRDLLLPPRKAAVYLEIETRALTYLLDSRQLPYETQGKGGVRLVRKSTLEAFKAQRRAS